MWLPLPYGDLEHVQAAQVPDGMLVTLLYGHRQSDGSPASQQVTFFVDQPGRVQEVGRRALGHDFPPLFEHRAWWVSPALDALVTLPDLLIDDGTVPDYGLKRFAPLVQARPAVVWMIFQTNLPFSSKSFARIFTRAFRSRRFSLSAMLTSSAE